MPAAALPYLGLPPAAAAGLCQGGDWRGELSQQQAQRGEWRAQGTYGAATSPAALAAGQQQRRRQQEQHQQAEAAAAGGAQDGGGAQQQEEQQQGEREAEQQRRWRWKRKLREEFGYEEPADAEMPGAGPAGPAPAAAAGAAEAAAECASGQLNLKQGALLAADALVTVSPGYAAEITCDPGMGAGMQELLAARGVA